MIIHCSWIYYYQPKTHTHSTDSTPFYHLVDKQATYDSRYRFVFYCHDSLASVSVALRLFVIVVCHLPSLENRERKNDERKQIRHSTSFSIHYSPTHLHITYRFAIKSTSTRCSPNKQDDADVEWFYFSLVFFRLIKSIKPNKFRRKENDAMQSWNSRH